MNDRYERIGEARDTEATDEPVHAPEFGNAAGHAATSHAGVDRYTDGTSIERYDEQYADTGSSNGSEPDGGFAPAEESPHHGAVTRPSYGPQAFEEPSSPLLLELDEIEDFKRRWPEIKAAFVDDPRDSVHLADQMLSEVTEMISHRVGEARARLEREWRGRNDVTTEDLRQSLHRYQVLFDRLTST